MRIQHSERAACHKPRQIIQPVPVCTANRPNRRGPRRILAELPITD